MTAAAAPHPLALPEEDGTAAFLLPARLRLALTAFSIAAHVGVVVALSLHGQNVAVLESINIDVIPQGDYTVDTVAIEGAAAAEAVEQHQMQEPQPQLKPSDAPDEGAAPPEATPSQSDAAPTQVLAPNPTAQSAELNTPEKAEKPQDKPSPTALQKIKQKLRHEAEEAERRKLARRAARHKLMAHRDEIRNARSSNQGGSEGHRAGVADGAAIRAARVSYGSIISAELNRHKAYPASARARGESGEVGVSFTVGGSGRIVNHAIYSSSGDSALDDEVDSMMAAAQAPPPPGGAFHGSIVIHFNLSR